VTGVRQALMLHPKGPHNGPPSLASFLYQLMPYGRKAIRLMEKTRPFFFFSVTFPLVRKTMGYYGSEMISSNVIIRHYIFAPQRLAFKTECFEFLGKTF